MTTGVDDLPLGAIKALAKRSGLRELAVFGSVARREASDDSDIDFLDVPGPGSPRWDFLRLGDDLEALLNRTVDLVPKEYLHSVIRDPVLADARGALCRVRTCAGRDDRPDGTSVRRGERATRKCWVRWSHHGPRARLRGSD